MAYTTYGQYQPPQAPKLDDPITRILQGVAQSRNPPQPQQQDPQAEFANAIAAFQAQNGVSPAQNASYAAGQPSKLDQINMAIDSGEPRAQQLQKYVKLVAGPDPARQNAAKQAIIDHPDDIDPTNSFQVMKALAQWAKMSPEQVAMQDVSNIVSGKGTDFFGLQQADTKLGADLAASEALQQKRTRGSNVPASIQIANEIEAARQAGDLQRVADLERVHKMVKLGEGMTMGIEGVSELPGYGSVSGGIKKQEKFLEKTGELEAGREDIAVKKAVGAKSSNQQIQLARELLPKATGSYLGAAKNIGKRIVGTSDVETQANAKLKAISGWLTSNVPRMEGPQSNYDVQVYREMAANVGDTTLPFADRMAAIDTIEEINNRYAGVRETPQEPSGNLTPEEQAELDQLDAKYGRR